MFVASVCSTVEDAAARWGHVLRGMTRHSGLEGNSGRVARQTIGSDFHFGATFVKDHGSQQDFDHRAQRERRCRILIVDDEQEVLAATATLLSARGWEVKTATGIDSAVSILEIDPSSIDVLIIDYLLSDGSGLDLLRTLESKGIRIPAVMCSGLDQQPAARDSNPPFRFLRKPYRLNDLEQAIGLAIEGRLD